MPMSGLMMRHLAVCLLVWGCSASPDSTALSVALDGEPWNPFLWEVSKDNETVAALLGTAHLPYKVLEGPGLDRINEELERLKPDAVFLELNMSHIMQVQSCSLRRDGQSSLSILREWRPETFAQLDQFLNLLGGPGQAGNPFSPGKPDLLMMLDKMTFVAMAMTLSLLLEQRAMAPWFLASKGQTLDAYLGNVHTNRRRQGEQDGGLRGPKGRRKEHPLWSLEDPEVQASVLQWGGPPQAGLDVLRDEPDKVSVGLSVPEQLDVLVAILSHLERQTAGFTKVPPPEASCIGGPGCAIARAWLSGDDEFFAVITGGLEWGVDDTLIKEAEEGGALHQRVEKLAERYPEIRSVFADSQATAVAQAKAKAVRRHGDGDGFSLAEEEEEREEGIGGVDGGASLEMVNGARAQSMLMRWLLAGRNEAMGARIVMVLDTLSALHEQRAWGGRGPFAGVRKLLQKIRLVLRKEGKKGETGPSTTSERPVPLFAVGAAHLLPCPAPTTPFDGPGETQLAGCRSVIEVLNRYGYRVRRVGSSEGVRLPLRPSSSHARLDPSLMAQLTEGWEPVEVDVDLLEERDKVTRDYVEYFQRAGMKWIWDTRDRLAGRTDFASLTA